MIMSSVILVVAWSFVSCLLLTPLVRNLAVRLGWLDRPDLERKFHRVPVPRVGGVPVVFACAGSFGVLLLMHVPGAPYIEQSLPVIWNLMPALILIFVTGLSDDLIGLKPIQKLGGQVLAAALACMGGLHFHIFAGLGLGSAWDTALTLVWLVACANAFNLIDGVDGLAAGLGLIATLTMLLAALLGGDVGVGLIAASLAGSMLGFLFFNFNPASIFLGDSGSLWIGFILGCLSVMLSQHSVTFSGMIAPALALSIPLLDTTLSFARRFVSGRPIFTGDHSHVHHRLIDRGFTPRRVCLSLYAASVLSSGFSLVLSVSSDLLGGVAMVVFCASSSTAIQFLHYREFEIFARLLRKVPSNVQSQLSLHAYEERLRGAVSPEECWCVLRQAGHEFGFTHISLQLGGCYFEERTTANGNGDWKLRLPLSASDYVRLTWQSRSLTAPEIGAQLADLLQRALSEKAGGFHAAPEHDRSCVIPANIDSYIRRRPVLERRKSA
jgi:UDP-GlcNAc:undecaprenyl-phosphate GlcNAc-1-phosphate transferase